jgi:hypothetical protein
VDSLWVYLPRARRRFEELPEVFTAVPVQELGLRGAVPCLAFLTRPNLRHLRGLELYAPEWSDDDWLWFADSPELRGLTGVLVSAEYPSDHVREVLQRRFHHNIGFAMS